MKRHIMIGLLTMLVLIPAVEAFSAPSWIMDFPFAPNTSALTFELIVTNLTNTPVQLTVNTVPTGGPVIPLTATIPAYNSIGYHPTDPEVGCPAGTACRIQLIYSGGATPVFGALLSIMTPAGQVVGYVAPTFNGATP